MSKARFAVISVVCLMLMAHISCETVECISGAPQTFEENEMLEFVKDCMLRTTRYEITYKTMEGLLQGGFLKTADYLLKNFFLKQTIDISGKMKLTVNEIKNKLEYLLKMISQVKKALVTMPVFMWGQSEDSIIIHVKFSHRFDTPGCLDISEETFEVKGKKLYYRANCMQTHQPINFIIDLNLYGEAEEEGKVIRKGSVGTRVLEFKKKDKKIWRNLHDSSEKFSRTQMRIWWELKEVYPQAMKEFQRLLDEDEEDDEELWGTKRVDPREEDDEEQSEKPNESSETDDSGSEGDADSNEPMNNESTVSEDDKSTEASDDLKTDTDL